MFRRSRPVAALPTELEHLRLGFQAYEQAQQHRPSRTARLRSAVWNRRRSHGLPLAVAVGTWLAGLWVQSPVGPPAWLVLIGGWVFLVATWFRAKPQHFAHTITCAVFLAAWLGLVALNAA